MTLEIIYRRPDGTLCRTLAFYSYRRGPVGEWCVGDVPLSEIDGEILSKRPWDASLLSHDWASEFQKPTVSS